MAQRLAQRLPGWANALRAALCHGCPLSRQTHEQQQQQQWLPVGVVEALSLPVMRLPVTCLAKLDSLALSSLHLPGQHCAS